MQAKSSVLTELDIELCVAFDIEMHIGNAAWRYANVILRGGTIVTSQT